MKKPKAPKPAQKEIVYENSDSDTDDDELLEQVYISYKQQLKQKRAKAQARQSGQPHATVHPPDVPKKPTLKFV